MMRGQLARIHPSSLLGTLTYSPQNECSLRRFLYLDETLTSNFLAQLEGVQDLEGSVVRPPAAVLKPVAIYR
jgi:hypothetical protein